MSATWKTVRVFISSTFRDMQAERDHLVRFVFPRLREELLARRIHLVDVDLRWGVTSDQDASEVCREVVDECHPRFLCMLGGRYGWVPKGKPPSITADEIHYGVLDREATKRGFAFFYFRDESTTAAMVGTTPGEFRELQGSDSQIALDKLKQTIADAGLNPFTYPAQWDKQSRRLIGLTKFGEQVHEDLLRSMKDDPELRDRFTGSAEYLGEFAEENAAMEAFIEERTERFVLGSRKAVMEELLAHANGTGGNGYLCLVGEPGSGKSALLAHFSQDSALNSQPSTLLIRHFVGASTGSTDVRRTLRRLCHELISGTGITAEIPEDTEKLRVAFPDILKQASAKKRVVILLDAINQFDSTPQLAGLWWLPEELPDSARIILSTLPGQTLDDLTRWRHPPREVPLPALTQTDGGAIIKEFLHRYRKTMTDMQRATLLAKTDAITPLYLLAALEELRTLGTYEEITDRIAQLPPETQALFTWILKRLEDDDGFRNGSGRKIGLELVPRFALLMGVSRHGLSQRELAELLAPGSDKATSPIPDDAQGNVAALVQLLRPYLMRRGELLDFYHGQFREAAATSYLPSESQQLAAHNQLATYFLGEADPERNQSWKGDSPRPFLEVVFHLTGAQRVDEFCQTLCDLMFVEARCQAGQVFELIADYRLAQENLPEAQAERETEQCHRKQIARYKTDLIAYAKAWSGRRDRKARGEEVSEPEATLPTPIPSCRMWTDEEIQTECLRITEHPARLDRLAAFSSFVSSQCYPLLEYGKRPGFVVQQALGSEPAGPVHDVAHALLPSVIAPILLRRWPQNAVHNPRPALLRTLEWHTGGVLSVSVTPDGLRAVSGSGDKTLRVWDMDSGQCLRTLEGHTDGVLSVSVTPDGLRAVSGSEDKTLRVWDLQCGQCLLTLEGHTGGVESVSVTPDGRRAVSCGDKTLRVWNLESGQCLRTLEGHMWLINSVSMTPDGRRAVSGSLDKTMRVWDLESGQCLRTLQVVNQTANDLVEEVGSGRLSPLKGYSWGVDSVCVTPDSRRTVSGSGDKALRVWDLESGQCLRTLEGHSDQITCVSVTPDGRRAVSGSNDDTLRVWDLESGQCLRTLEGHSERVNSVSVTLDGRRAISGSSDETLRVWDLESGQCLHTLERHTADINSVSVTPDGRRAVSGSEDKTLRVWDSESGQCLRTLEGHSAEVSLSTTPHGRRAISGSADRTLRLWDLESGQCLRTLEGAGWVMSVSVTPDSRRAVSGGSDNNLRVWDMESGKCLRILEGHSEPVCSVSVTPDGRRAVSGSGDNTLRVWDLESGQCLRTLEGHSAVVLSVNVTPDGRRVVSGSGDTTLIDSPDGWRRVESRSGDKALRVWDMESGQCLRTLEGHTASVNSVNVTPDGRRAVSGSKDKTIRVWDLESGQCLGVFVTDALVIAVGNFSCRVVAGTATGEMLFLELRKFPLSAAILTARRLQGEVCKSLWSRIKAVMHIESLQKLQHLVSSYSPHYATRCSVCGNEFEWNSPQPSTLSACPHCAHAIIFNPFIVDLSDEAHEASLRCGLAHCRQAQGDYESTIAYLAALAAHLQKMGKPAEAAEFQREHDVLAAQMAAENMA